MKIKFNLLIVLFFALQINSQSKDIPIIYVDEDLSKIEILLDKEMSKYWVYKSVFKTDSLVSVSRNYNMILGEFNEEKVKPYYDEISEEYGVNIDSYDAIIIHFIDTLFGYKAKRKLETPMIKKLPSGDTLILREPEYSFINKRKTFDKRVKKCLKKGRKKGHYHLYTYRTIQGELFDYQHVNWQHISSKLSSVLLSGGSALLILTPQGEFYRFRKRHYPEGVNPSWDNYTKHQIQKLDSMEIIELADTTKSTKKRYLRMPKSSNEQVPLVASKEEYRKWYENFFYNYIEPELKCYSVEF